MRLSPTNQHHHQPPDRHFPLHPYPFLHRSPLCYARLPRLRFRCRSIVGQSRWRYPWSVLTTLHRDMACMNSRPRAGLPRGCPMRPHIVSAVVCFTSHMLVLRPNIAESKPESTPMRLMKPSKHVPRNRPPRMEVLHTRQCILDALEHYVRAALPQLRLR